MAVRKTSTRKTTKKSPLKPASKGKNNRVSTSAVFWSFLLIVIIIAFFMLVPIIKNNLKLTPKTAETEQRQEQPEILSQPDPPSSAPPKPPPEQKPVASEQKTPENKQPDKNPQTEKPAEPAPPVQPSSPQPAKPAETRDRSIYLIQESNMAQVKANRKLNVSDTPLQDSINALLAGPTTDERRRGMISLVPEGSKLLKARVDGRTAYLDFNQEFRYNTRGSEGCAAQIKQIVWTATEFSNVQDVQFLIEGNIVNFLSEGVVINSPIGR